MSGFLALVELDGADVSPELVQGLTERLAYRGPDGVHTWVRGAAGMGYAQFRTTHQMAHERQPFSLDGRTWLVGDVRVDGREDLVRRLGISSDVDLETTSDIELAARAFEHGSLDGLAHLVGDYAFAAWDRQRRELTCARSPFGMRSLYYAHVGSSLLVSNSLPVIRAHPAVSDRLDDVAIGDFLLTGEHNAIDKSLTAYADIRAVPPSHALLLRDGRLSIRRFWDFPQDVPTLRYAIGRDYVEHFWHVFRQAVVDRLRTPDVVLTMSGGMDSSSVGAVLADERARGRMSTCVQLVTAEFETLPLPRERPFAQRTADRLGLPIQFVRADDYRLLEPPVETSNPVEYYNPAFWVEVGRVVASHARVQLTGSSGDNLLVYKPVLEGAGIPAQAGLVGMHWLRQALAHRRMPTLGTGWLRRLKHVKQPWSMPTWINPELSRKLGLRERFEHWCEHLAAVGRGSCNRVQASLEDNDWCAEGLLRPDGFHPVQERDPYLDVRLLRFVLALPPIPWRWQKHVLRQAMVGRLPRQVLTRRKTVLGALHEVLLQHADPTIVDQWRGHADLGRFVERDRVPAVCNTQASTAESYVNLRPLLLDTWLGHRW